MLKFISEATANGDNGTGLRQRDRQESFLVAVTVTGFSIHYEQADSELAEHA